MPVSEIIRLAEGQILIWDLCETVEQLLGRQTVVTQDELEQFTAQKRKREYLATRVALMELTGAEIQVDYTHERKPFAVNSNLQLSFSHSADRVAVMIHPEKCVGVDIEKQGNKVAALYTRFMGEQEQCDFGQGSDVHVLQIIWSAKEALYKIIGKEAVDFAETLRVLPFNRQESGALEALHLPKAKKYTLHYMQKEGYTLVYCIE